MAWYPESNTTVKKNQVAASLSSYGSKIDPADSKSSPIDSPTKGFVDIIMKPELKQEEEMKTNMA